MKSRFVRSIEIVALAAGTAWLAVILVDVTPGVSLAISAPLPSERLAGRLDEAHYRIIEAEYGNWRELEPPSIDEVLWPTHRHNVRLLFKNRWCGAGWPFERLSEALELNQHLFADHPGKMAFAAIYLRRTSAESVLDDIAYRTWPALNAPPRCLAAQLIEMSSARRLTPERLAVRTAYTLKRAGMGVEGDRPNLTDCVLKTHLTALRSTAPNRGALQNENP